MSGPIRDLDRGGASATSRETTIAYSALSSTFDMLPRRVSADEAGAPVLVPTDDRGGLSEIRR